MNIHQFNKLLKKNDANIIELGAGNKRQFSNSITIDIVNCDGVDVVVDVNKGLKFISDNSIDEIYASHFIEHVENIDLLMSEVFRVLKKGGIINLVVPHFSNPHYYSDYTHKYQFGLYSFSYFSKSKYFKREVPTYYNDINFEIEIIKIMFGSRFKALHVFRVIYSIIFNVNKIMQEIYEECFCYIFPATEIQVVLKKK